MNYLKSHSKAHNARSRSIHSFLGIVLLCIYVVGNLGQDFLHDVFHEHEATEQHSAQLEMDACHRTIYHQDTINGCEHQAHFSQSEDCDFQHALVQPHHWVTFSWTEFKVQKQPDYDTLYLCSATTSNDFQAPLRGPPIS